MVQVSTAFAILHLSHLLSQCPVDAALRSSAISEWSLGSLDHSCTGFVCWSWETLPQVFQPGNLLYGSLGLDSSLLNVIGWSLQWADHTAGHLFVTQCHLLFNAIHLLTDQSCRLACLSVSETLISPAHFFSPNFSITIFLIHFPLSHWGPRGEREQ